MAKKVGRPTIEAEGPQTHQLQTRVSAAFLQKLDEWRATQRPIPSRTEAIRILTEAGIEAITAGLESEAEAQKKKRGKR